MQQRNQIFIRELDPDIIRPSIEDVRQGDYGRGGSKILIIGKAGTGKTSLLTSLLYEKRECFPVGLVMSGTEDTNHHYSRIFPETFIYNNLDQEVIEKLVKRQKVARKFLPNPMAVLVLDDCMDDPKIFNQKLFQSLYKNGRHWAIFYVLMMQYCMDVKPFVRINTDGVFILREPSLRSRKLLYENYASVIPTFKLFCHLMDQITVDYTAMYIHNQVSSNNWQDCVFWYRAKPVPSSFRFGCRDYWEFHAQRYNEQYEGSF